MHLCKMSLKLVHALIHAAYIHAMCTYIPTNTQVHSCMHACMQPVHRFKYPFLCSSPHFPPSQSAPQVPDPLVPCCHRQRCPHSGTSSIIFFGGGGNQFQGGQSDHCIQRRPTLPQYPEGGGFAWQRNNNPHHGAIGVLFFFEGSRSSKACHNSPSHVSLHSMKHRIFEESM